MLTRCTACLGVFVQVTIDGANRIHDVASQHSVTNESDDGGSYFADKTMEGYEPAVLWRKGAAVIVDESKTLGKIVRTWQEKLKHLQSQGKAERDLSVEKLACTRHYFRSRTKRVAAVCYSVYRKPPSEKDKVIV